MLVRYTPAIGLRRSAAFESLEPRTLMSTYYVSPSGSDGNAGTEGSPWRTLSHAAGSVAGGDELVLAGGQYAGGVTFDAPNLLIRGADASDRPVIAAPINNSSVHQSVRIGVNGSGAVLRNLDIAGGYYYALKLESYWDQAAPGPEPAARDVLVEDCVLRDSGRDCVKITPDCNNVTIRRCEVYNSGLRDATNAEGIDNVNGDGFVLQDSYVHDVATNGVYVKGGASGCVIERNRIEGCGSLGISLGFYTDAEFFDPENTADYYENVDGVVRNNVVVDTHYAGIGLYAALRPRVYNNTLVNVATGAQAAVLFAPGDVAGVASPTRDAAVVNNVVSAAPGRAVLQVRVAGGAAGLAGTLTMSNNRYHSPSGAPSFRDDRSGFSGTLAQWQALSGADAASTAGDPGLDASGRPASASGPLVDAGADLSAQGFTDDLDGQARPSGAAWDVGADEVNGTPGPTPTTPAAPTTLAASAGSATQVTLSWADASSNESGFRVERRTGSGSWGQIATVGAGVTSYTNNGVLASTSYEYRVRAYNGAGNSAYSNVASVTTPANPGPTPTGPSAPTGVSAVAASATRVNVTWADASSNETGFRVERRLAGGTWGEVGTVGAGVTTYADTGLLADTAYEYRVRAYNATGNSAYSNVGAATTPAAGGDGRTFIASFGLVDGRKTKLTWLDGDGTAVTAVLAGGGTAQAYVDASGRLAVEAGTTGLKSVLTIKGKGGDGRVALGDVRVGGSLKGLSAKTGDLSGTVAVAGAVGKLLLGGISGGTVAAAGPILSANVLGATTNGRLLAGVSLGADGRLGGAGADADAAAGFGIRRLLLGGPVAGSTFAAGALPGANGTYGDSDDTLVGGAASAMTSVTARAAVDAGTRFVAGLFGNARIAKVRVDVATDERFVLLA